MTRRLIGWRVRWEEWGDGWNGWAARASAWFFVHPTLRRHARASARAAAKAKRATKSDARNVRLMRVYRRSKR